MMMVGEIISFPGEKTPVATGGSAGLPTQIPGAAATVSNTAIATGGISGGNMIVPDCK